METGGPIQPQGLGESPPGLLRACLADAVRFGELRRLAYNLILTAFVVIWIVRTWPHFRAALTFHSLLLLCVLALLANLCYCAAYFVDVPMQCSSLGSVWKRRRWALW